MKILVKRNSKYFNVCIETTETKIDLGLYDGEESIVLASELILAAEELLSPSHSFHERLLEAIRENL